jgi:hypothetical protein
MRQPGGVRTRQRRGGPGDHRGRAGRLNRARGHKLAQIAALRPLGHHIQPPAALISIEDPG